MLLHHLHGCGISSIKSITLKLGFLENVIDTCAGFFVSPAWITSKNTKRSRSWFAKKKWHPNMQNWNHISGIPLCEAMSYLHVFQCPQTDQLEGKKKFRFGTEQIPSVNFEEKNCWSPCLACRTEGRQLRSRNMPCWMRTCDEQTSQIWGENEAPVHGGGGEILKS